MPGTNLTREEAATRAAPRHRRHPRRRARRHEGSRDLRDAQHHQVHLLRARRRDLPRLHRRLRRVGHRQRDRGRPGGRLRRQPGPRSPGLAADNEVVVVATGRYTNTGEGLHRFVDPVDDEVYLYSQFEVPDSRRMYPVFEQPDLKAEFALHRHRARALAGRLELPHARAGARGRGQPRRGASSAPRASPATSPRSSPAPTTSCATRSTSRAGEVPLGIFCRRSLTPYLDADELFALTKKGFAFFEEEFDCAYPFAKYDQLFTPEFNAGAMENAGAVTIAEVYVFRSKVTEALIERRALTVLHELAHMWFGNLVTMRWWDDLWLNESFAEWASTTCQAEATHWTDAWTTFATHEKDWAYRQDQLSSTHPIVAEINDLAGRRGQLRRHHLRQGRLGPQAARRLRRPRRVPRRHPGLLRHARLGQHHPRRPADRARDHLGPRPALVVQALARDRRRRHPAPRHRGRRPRPHRRGRDRPVLRPGLRDLPPAPPRDRPLRPPRGRPAPHRPLRGRRRRRCAPSCPQLVGREQPDLLLVNEDDLAYAKIRFDERSLATALSHPRGFESSLPRALFLASAWDMTRDAEMGARRFVDVVLATLPGEDDSTLLRTLSPSCTSRSSATPRPSTARPPARRPATASSRSPASPSPAATPSSSSSPPPRRSPPPATTRRSCAPSSTAPRCSTASRSTSRCAGPSSRRSSPPGRPTPTPSRPSAGARTPRPVASAPPAPAPPDPPPRPRRRRGSRRSRATACPTTIVDALGLGFGRAGTPAELLRPYVERYHEMLEAVPTRKGSHAIVESVVRLFYPRGLADRALVDASEAWLAAHPEAPAALRRLVGENRDPSRAPWPRRSAMPVADQASHRPPRR